MSMKETLEQAIWDAFSSVPYPGDDAYFGEFGVEDFKEQHWSQLSREVISYHQDDLWFFTEKGYQFYLPAFLLASLHVSHIDDICSYTVASLCPLTTLNRKKQEKFLRRARQFTVPQRHAVTNFLKFIYEIEKHEDVDPEQLSNAEFALKSYWTLAATGEEVPAAEIVPPGEGVWWIRMPDVLGKPLDAALALLRSQGLTDVRVTDRSYGHTPEVVFRTLPEPGELARLRDQPTLFIQIDSSHIVGHGTTASEPASITAADPSKPPPDYF